MVTPGGVTNDVPQSDPILQLCASTNYLSNTISMEISDIFVVMINNLANVRFACRDTYDIQFMLRHPPD